MSSIVVADAGPLHYLVLIDCGEILGKLFDHVLIPFAVRDELFHHRAPQKVKDWIARPPSWFEVAAVQQAHPVRGLHKGETEALQLALEAGRMLFSWTTWMVGPQHAVSAFQRFLRSQSWNSRPRRN